MFPHNYITINNTIDITINTTINTYGTGGGPATVVLVWLSDSITPRVDEEETPTVWKAGGSCGDVSGRTGGDTPPVGPLKAPRG
eukprot:gene31595-25939_t